VTILTQNIIYKQNDDIIVNVYRSPYLLFIITKDEMSC